MPKIMNINLFLRLQMGCERKGDDDGSYLDGKKITKSL